MFFLAWDVFAASQTGIDRRAEVLPDPVASRPRAPPGTRRVALRSVPLGRRAVKASCGPIRAGSPSESRSPSACSPPQDRRRGFRPRFRSLDRLDVTCSPTCARTVPHPSNIVGRDRRRAEPRPEPCTSPMGSRFREVCRGSLVGRRAARTRSYTGARRQATESRHENVATRESRAAHRLRPHRATGANGRDSNKISRR